MLRHAYHLNVTYIARLSYSDPGFLAHYGRVLLVVQVEIIIGRRAVRISKKTL